MQTEDLALLSLLADIRKAAGDPTGKLMQDELVAHIAALRVNADRYLWLRENWSYTVSDGPKEIDVGDGKTIYGCLETEVEGNEMDAAIDAARSAK